MPIARTLPQSDQGSGFVGSHLQSTGMLFVLDRGGFCHSTTPNGSKSRSLSRPIVAIVGFATGFGTIVVNGPKDQRCLSYWKFGFFLCARRATAKTTNQQIDLACVCFRAFKTLKPMYFETNDIASAERLGLGWFRKRQFLWIMVPLDGWKNIVSSPLCQMDGIRKPGFTNYQVSVEIYCYFRRNSTAIFIFRRVLSGTGMVNNSQVSSSSRPSFSLASSSTSMSRLVDSSTLTFGGNQSYGHFYYRTKLQIRIQ
jgi:hypothetical protein